jgi:hypothetical protein
VSTEFKRHCYYTCKMLYTVSIFAVLRKKWKFLWKCLRNEGFFLHTENLISSIALEICTVPAVYLDFIVYLLLILCSLFVRFIKIT